MEKIIKIIKDRRKECIKYMRYLESKLEDTQYQIDNRIDYKDLDKEIDEFNFRVLECDVILKKIKEAKQ